MTKLGGKHFEKQYRILLGILPSKMADPSPDVLKALYHGTLGAPGFCRFSQESFDELIGLAIQECRWMPTPTWFAERSQELSAPGRQVFAATDMAALPGTQERLNREQIQAIWDESTKQAAIGVAFKRHQAAELTRVDGHRLWVNAGFAAWIEVHTIDLCRRFPNIARRAGRNEANLGYLLKTNEAVQIAYLDSLKGPQTWEAVCPRLFPENEQCQKQLGPSTTPQPQKQRPQLSPSF